VGRGGGNLAVCCAGRANTASGCRKKQVVEWPENWASPTFRVGKPSVEGKKSTIMEGDW